MCPHDCYNIYNKLLVVDKKGRLRRLSCPFYVTVRSLDSNELINLKVDLIADCVHCGMFFYISGKPQKQGLFNVILEP